MALNGIEFAINPIDSDGVESNDSLLVTLLAPEHSTSAVMTNLLFGRIVVEDAYSPEMRRLLICGHTEYCTAVVVAGQLMTPLSES